MSKMLLCGRLWSDQAEIDAQHFRTGKFSDDEWIPMYDFAEKALRLPLLIDDKPKRTPSELRAMFRKWKRDHDLRFCRGGLSAVRIP